MKHTKIITDAAGDKYQLYVNFSASDFSEPTYRVAISKCPKGKRTFVNCIDSDSYSHRALSMEQRAASIKSQIIDMIGADAYNEALKECWLKLEPKYI